MIKTNSKPAGDRQLKLNEKLVRDRVPGLYNLPCRKADPAEMPALLRAKLEEETHELFTHPSAEELADVFEVLTAIMAHFGLAGEFQAAIAAKREKHGAFKEQLVAEIPAEQMRDQLLDANIVRIRAVLRCLKAEQKELTLAVQAATAEKTGPFPAGRLSKAISV